MIYKNSMKLLTSNFKFVWKQLAYTLVRLAIVLGLSLLVARPIMALLNDGGFFNSIKELGETLYTSPKSFFVEAKNCVILFIDIISGNFNQVWPYVCLFLFVILFVNTFLKSIGKYALTGIAHNNLTALNNTGYCHYIVSHFGAASKYAVARWALDIPFFILKIGFVALYCVSLTSFLMAVILIPVLIVFLVLTFAFQISLYSGITVRMVEGSKNPFSKIAQEYKDSKNFWKVFSNALVVVFTIIICNIIIGVFSIGAGLLITVPASMVLVVIFELVAYYNSTKQRYYLSPTIIVDPTAEKETTISQNQK